MSLRAATWIVVGVAVGFLALLILWRPPNPTPPAPSVAIGGPFHMTDQTGRPVDQTILKDKWSAVFFGYTYCPDVCPTTLQMLGAASQSLGGRAKDFQVVFVTVDPQRDTPAQMKAYLSNAIFPHGAIGLTGTPQQVAAMASAYGVYYQKQGTGADYAVNHSSVIYLINPKGRYDSVFSANLTPDQAKSAILKAMNGESGSG
jgi:protein SCO1